MVLEVEKILPISHVPSFYNKLHLVDALFARTQTSFGIGQTVQLHQWKRFSQADTTHMVQHFPIQLLQTEESSQSI